MDKAKSPKRSGDDSGGSEGTGLWRPDLEFMRALLSRSESFSNMSGYCWDCRHYEGRPHAPDCLVGFLERFLLYVERDKAWSEFCNALRLNLEAQEAEDLQEDYDNRADESRADYDAWLEEQEEADHD